MTGINDSIIEDEEIGDLTEEERKWMGLNWVKRLINKLFGK